MLVELLILLLRIYQRLISPLFGRVCRFEPSCSNYAIGCLQNHGALRGSYLTLRRLLRCHPFHPGGHDPPPPAPARPTLGLDGPADFRNRRAQPDARPSREARHIAGPCNLDVRV